MAKAIANAKTGSALEAIEKNIGLIRTRGKALRDLCQTTLVMIIEHYVDHGDMTKLNPFTEAVKYSLGTSMSAGVNRWVQRFVPSLRWDEEKGAFVHQKGVKPEIVDLPEDKAIKSKTLKDADDKAILLFGNPRKIGFWELEPETRQTPFDITVAFKRLLDQAERAYEKNVKEGGKNKIDIDTLKRMEDMAVSIGAVKAEDLPRRTEMGSNASNPADDVIAATPDGNGQEKKAA